MKVTNGYCPVLGMGHKECGGRCKAPHEHWCDAPFPPDPDVRCIEPIGHRGKCCGGNGPTFDTPEEYRGRSKVPASWRAKLGETKRPDTEKTLEAFS